MTTHPHLAPRLKKEYSYTSTALWAFMACSRENFTFTLSAFIQQFLKVFADGSTSYYLAP
jgi:hypothetical protein